MAKKANKTITVMMIPDKVTKNTIRFVEVVPDEFTAPKVGTQYVQKATLGELTYKEGKVLKMTLEAVDAEQEGGKAYVRN